MAIRDEVLKRKDNFIKDLQGWIQTKGVLDPQTAKINQPFGEDVKNSLDFIYNLALRDGFKVTNYDGYCVEIEYGDSKESVAILGHADVVPEGKGWIHKEYGGEIEGKLIYGRGSSDDKGPTLAAYYALNILKDLKVPLKRRIRIIVGGNEENGSQCLEYYFRTLNKEAPTYGFTPDADFPLIYGEKGILTYKYQGEYEDNVIEYMFAGEASNAVPSECEVVLKGVYDIDKEIGKYLKSKKCSYKYEIKENKTYVTVYGKAAHAAFPEGGINSVARTLEALAKCTNSNFAKFYAKKFSDYYGKYLNIAKKSKEMGKLTMNVGIARYENNNYTFVLNIRYPENANGIIIGQKLEQNSMHKGEVLSDSKPLYNDPKSPFIQTLMNVYKEVTGDKKAKPITIGGGTYARETINTVAFGMDFKRNNGSGNIHSPEEALNIDDAIDGMEIYAKAIMELANL